MNSVWRCPNRGAEETFSTDSAAFEGPGPISSFEGIFIGSSKHFGASTDSAIAEKWLFCIE